MMGRSEREKEKRREKRERGQSANVPCEQQQQRQKQQLHTNGNGHKSAIREKERKHDLNQIALDKTKQAPYTQTIYTYIHRQWRALPTGNTTKTIRIRQTSFSWPRLDNLFKIFPFYVFILFMRFNLASQRIRENSSAPFVFEREKKRKKIKIRSTISSTIERIRCDAIPNQT